ncbi:MAG: YqaJ viral recombinase family protein [Thiocapsa sp.]|uniref:YqaJ viral recombinase family nuclease n=1 Tax=Thiocapsa sp. TaxID=2024551 RepID=UPI001BCE00D6|nr:YqaJ viral recombinase family protein [Thiocapsa sp.]QVL47007.1 MAG: YqaJ viral recombinase family protein [Thiocapsa sp.]
MKLVPLKQRTPAWEHWRSEGVTASEAPVILGRSPYKTPWRLWAERTGVVTPEDLSAKPCVQRGIALEDQVRRAFEDRHGTLLLPLCAESTEHPVLRCSLDGLNDDGEPVELKVPTERTYRRLDRERELTTAYQLAWAQLQFQLFVTEAPRGWLVFDPCLAGSTPLEFAIARDEPFLTTALVPACLAFHKCIIDGQAPEYDRERDLYTPVDGALTEWTQAARTYRALTEDRGHLEGQLKALKTRMTETEGVFLRLMDDALLAESAGVRVTRYRQDGNVDYTALLKAIAPDLDDATRDRYRRPASQRIKVTLQGETVPPVDLPPLAATATSFYF